MVFLFAGDWLGKSGWGFFVKKWFTFILLFLVWNPFEISGWEFL
jgi:hypothetical protein